MAAPSVQELIAADPFCDDAGVDSPRCFCTLTFRSILRDLKTLTFHHVSPDTFRAPLSRDIIILDSVK